MGRVVALIMGMETCIDSQSLGYPVPIDYTCEAPGWPRSPELNFRAADSRTGPSHSNGHWASCDERESPRQCDVNE